MVRVNKGTMKTFTVDTNQEEVVSAGLAIENREQLRQHVLDAFALGSKINLGHCVYGPATGGTRGYINETQPYYYLLAGHLALTRAKSVLEIGTHYGGSTLAMLEGLRKSHVPELHFVTMDVTSLNDERLSQEQDIHHIIGDSTDIASIRMAKALLGTDKLDLLYIDALKEPGFVLKTMRNMREAGIDVTFIILDDVQTNHAMRAFWSLLEQEAPDGSFLISGEFPHIRKPEMGYGIIYVPGARNLLARCGELMEKLGLVPTESQKVIEATGLRQSLANAGKSYGDENKEQPLDESSPAEIGLLYALARDHYTGAGDIVETGSFLGATTRALCEGLHQNERVDLKIARINCFDHFVHDNMNFEKYVNGRVQAGASTLPAFAETLSGHLEKVNIFDVSPRTHCWNGRPIELLVLGSQRTPQTVATAAKEFFPHLAPGRSFVLVRDFRKLTRPWAAYGMLSVAKHFEFLYSANSFAVFLCNSPVPAWAMTRLVQNDFSIAERIDLMRSFALEPNRKDKLAVDLLVSAGVIAAKEGSDQRTALFAEARRMAGEDAGLQQKVSKFAEQHSISV
jgi:predicted O-methyltransferase YrrM